jgi:hypothetical protein
MISRTPLRGFAVSPVQGDRHSTHRFRGSAGPEPEKEDEAIEAGVMPPPRVDPRLGVDQLPRRRWDHGRGWH